MTRLLRPLSLPLPLTLLSSSELTYPCVCVTTSIVFRTLKTPLVFRDVHNLIAKINASHKQSFCLSTILKYILELTNFTVGATCNSKTFVCSILHLMSCRKVTMTNLKNSRTVQKSEGRKKIAELCNNRGQYSVSHFLTKIKA